TPHPFPFDTVVQNEVCNGPSPCNFPQGGVTDPGSIAYVSGHICTAPWCVLGPFRVAQVGLCATAPGQAVLHWQFSPPAPPDRDTEILSFYHGDQIQDWTKFSDYVINVVGPSQVLDGHVNWQGRPSQPDPLQQLPITLA